MPIVIIPSGEGLVVTPQIGVIYNPAVEPRLGIIYTSVGERWDSIAFKMYGNPTLVQPLINNNPGIPIDDIIDQGARVFVPLLVINTPQGTSTPWG